MVSREGVEGIWDLEFSSCSIWDLPKVSWSSFLWFQEPESSGLGLGALGSSDERLRVVLEMQTQQSKQKDMEPEIQVNEGIQRPSGKALGSLYFSVRPLRLRILGF